MYEADDADTQIFSPNLGWQIGGVFNQLGMSVSIHSIYLDLLRLQATAPGNLYVFEHQIMYMKDPTLDYSVPMRNNPGVRVDGVLQIPAAFQLINQSKYRLSPFTPPPTHAQRHQKEKFLKKVYICLFIFMKRKSRKAVRLGCIVPLGPGLHATREREQPP